MKQAYMPLIVAGGLLVSQTVAAKVIESSSSHFVIDLEANTTTTPTEAYKQFIQIGEWWDSEHSWFGRSDAFSLDATAGDVFVK